MTLCVNPRAVCCPLKGCVSLDGHRNGLCLCLLGYTDGHHYRQTFLAHHQLGVDYRTCHFALSSGLCGGRLLSAICITITVKPILYKVGSTLCTFCAQRSKCQRYIVGPLPLQPQWGHSRVPFSIQCWAAARVTFATAWGERSARF